MKKKYKLSVALLVLLIAGILLWQSQVPKAPQAVGTGAAIVAVNVPKQFSAKALAGAQIFKQNCASCHGNNAAGQVGVAPPLVHRIYKPNHHPDEAFYRAAKFGVASHHWRFGNMPPIKNLSRADMVRVVAYVRALQKANGIK